MIVTRTSSLQLVSAKNFCHKFQTCGVLNIETHFKCLQFIGGIFIKMKKSYYNYALMLAVLVLSTTVVSAGEFCKNNNYRNGDNVSFSNLREKTISAVSNLQVDGGKNGGISVKGENRSDILVRACVKTWAKTGAKAKSLASGIRIETGSKVYAANTPSKGWSVSFQILVPKSTGLNLSAHNGGDWD